MNTDKRHLNRSIDSEEIHDIHENIRNVASDLKQLLYEHSSAEDKAISELLSRQSKIEADLSDLTQKISDFITVWGAIKLSLTVLEKLGIFLKWLAGLGSVYFIIMQYLDNGK